MLTATNVKVYPADAVKRDKIREAAAGYGFSMQGQSGKAESFGILIEFQWLPESLRLEIKRSGVLDCAEVFALLDPIIKKA